MLCNIACLLPTGSEAESSADGSDAEEGSQEAAGSSGEEESQEAPASRRAPRRQPAGRKRRLSASAPAAKRRALEPPECTTRRVTPSQQQVKSGKLLEAMRTPTPTPRAKPTPVAPAKYSQRILTASAQGRGLAQSKVEEKVSTSGIKQESSSRNGSHHAGSGSGRQLSSTWEVSDPTPCAIVGEDATSRKFFCLVQRLKRKAQSRGHVALRWLKEGADGLFRPTDASWEERSGALIPVRTRPTSANGSTGYRLLTQRSTILKTELLD